MSHGHLLYSVPISHRLGVGIDPAPDTPRSLIRQINATGIPGAGLCLSTPSKFVSEQKVEFHVYLLRNELL